MNSSGDKTQNVSFANEHVHVNLPNDISLSFPIVGNSRLERATPEQLIRVEVDEDGLHWPDLDEDLSFAGLLRGDYGQHVRKVQT